MPETKKKKGKSAGSGSRSGGKKSSAGRSGGKKAAARKPENAFFPQIAPLILAACAVLTGVCVMVDQGVIGHGIRGVITGLFGGASYALPVLLLVRALFLNRDREEGRSAGRSVSAGAVLILLAMTVHILGGGVSTVEAKVHYEAGQSLTGGGVVGGVLGQLLLRGFGRVFSVIVLFAALLLLCLYIAGISPRGVWVAAVYHADRLVDRIREKREAEAEIRRTSGPTRSQMKEEEYLRYLREKRAREKEAREAAPTASRRGERKTGPEQIPMEAPALNPDPARQKEVFHVRKRRLTELDIPVTGPADSVSASDPAPAAPVKGKKARIEETPVRKDPETGWAADAFRAPDELSDPVQAELASPEADSTAVDEKIFDELLRKRQESSLEEEAPLSGPRAKVQAVVSGGEPIPDDHAAEPLPDAPSDGRKKRAGRKQPAAGFADDAFDADRYLTDEPIETESPESVNGSLDEEPVLIPEDPGVSGTADPMAEDDAGIAAAVSAAAAQSASQSARRNDKPAPVKTGEIRKPKKTADGETGTAALVSEIAAGDDISDLFLNPEDAELLDRLSEQYRNPLEVKRETVSAPQKEELRETAPDYLFPPVDLLTEDPGGGNEDIKDELQDNAVKLVDTLKSFKVNTKIENISRGPTITRYELVPEPGTKVRSITNLVDDIALNLATTGVRIEAPIPGKSAVGIEVPNKKRTTVHLRTLLEDERFVSAKSRLTVALGEDVAGDPVFFDVGKMPHLLIAGTTGSGKSVCINTIIMSLLYKASPDDVKMILIDPKKVELNIYNGIPHLLVPVVSEPKKAAGSLSWAVSEMERRYGLIEDAGKRNIGEYNKLAEADPSYERLPSIVIIIDELADLMMTAPDDVEDSICRIAQKARAAGMYLIVGTQRPSVDVITGLIKANIPSRIAFRTSNQVDSRTIIDIGSAANLIGMGDMLFAPVGALKPNRVQGAFVSEDDVLKAVSYIRNMNSVAEGYNDEIVNQIEREAQRCGAGKKGAAQAQEDDGDDGDEDPMLKPAIEVALDAGKISTSLIQRRLKLGYGRAAKLIDRMEQLGYVSAPNGPHPREVLITRAQWQESGMRDDDPPPFDL